MAGFAVANGSVSVSGGDVRGWAEFLAGGALNNLSVLTTFAIADVDTKPCVIRTSDTNVAVKNRLGVGTVFTIKVEFGTVPN